jgi:ferrous iron transport protein B
MPPTETFTATRTIALAGNPNCGKTTLFNALTGLRQKVGNYPGVTVEKKEGRLRVGDAEITVVDLPGVYSLSARSLDEQVTRNVLLGWQAGAVRPDAVVAITDASNLERNLYLASQLMELGRPVILALNMMDLAAQNGVDVDAEILAAQLGVPVIPIVASKSVGLDRLARAMAAAPPPIPARQWKLPPAVESEVAALAAFIRENDLVESAAVDGEAVRLLLNDLSDADDAPAAHYAAHLTALTAKIEAARERLERADIDWWSAEAEGRYGWIKPVCERAVFKQAGFAHTTSDRIDKVLTHRVFGPLIFAVLMLAIFQSIFQFAEYPMERIDDLFAFIGDRVATVIPADQPGGVGDLIKTGVITGVGGVVKFLPQILILMFFIALLEDTGYMARAAFIMDRIMRRVGLSGKSFIPLLSSFACAIPGIAAARTVENAKDRLVTILIAPLMSCSARLPVYALMIGAFFPKDVRLFGFLPLGGFVMFGMYLLGIVVAVGMAWLFKRTLLRGASPPLIMELPPYRLPSWRNVGATLGSSAGQFLQRAGTVILALSIVLWFLAAYPTNVSLSKNYDAERKRIEEQRTQFSVAATEGAIPKEEADAQIKALADTEKTLRDEEKAERLEKSFMGRAGKIIEPAVRPLGFNWKIGVGILSAFAAREVLVGTLAIIYDVGDDADEDSDPLHQALQQDKYADGTPVFSPLVAISLMVFFVLALQCMSTFAIVRRETNGWRWPFLMLGYMTLLAYVGSLLTYQGGKLLGF